MTEYFYLFIANVLVLFSVVNPIGNGFIVNNNYLAALSHEERKIIIWKIAKCAFLVCVGGLFIGKFLLALFGLSIPIIQLAGGMIICRSGWMLFFDDSSEVDNLNELPPEKLQKMQYDYLSAHVFYPLTFPVMIGAGTFSTLLTLAANATTNEVLPTVFNFIVVVLAIAAICVVVYFTFVNIAAIQKYLGRDGNIVVKKMSSFFTICIGLKIVVSGFGGVSVMIVEKVSHLL